MSDLGPLVGMKSRAVPYTFRKNGRMLIMKKVILILFMMTSLMFLVYHEKRSDFTKNQ
jgi:hypothetical protein